MTNEIVVTFKGQTQSDPWIVVHADPGVIDAALDSITGDLIAKIHATQAIFAGTAAVAAVAPQPAAATPPPAQQASWGAPAESPSAPQAPAPAPAAPAAPAGPLPAGVAIWADGGKVWLDNPFIANKAKRDALNAQLKSIGGRFDGDNTKNWYFPMGTEAQLAQFCAEAYA